MVICTMPKVKSSVKTQNTMNKKMYIQPQSQMLTIMSPTILSLGVGSGEFAGEGGAPARKGHTLYSPEAPSYPDASL